MAHIAFYIHNTGGGFGGKETAAFKIAVPAAVAANKLVVTSSVDVRNLTV